MQDFVVVVLVVEGAFAWPGCCCDGAMCAAPPLPLPTCALCCCTFTVGCLGQVMMPLVADKKYRGWAACAGGRHIHLLGGVAHQAVSAATLRQASDKSLFACLGLAGAL